MTHRFNMPATFSIGADSLHDSLVSHWPLTEATGIRRDLLGGYHLLPSSSTGTNVDAVAGKINRAADFLNSANSFLYRPQSTFHPYAHDNWSYGAWIYSTDDGGWDPFASHWITTGNQRGWYIGIDWSGSNNKIEFGVSSGGTSGTTSYVTTATGSVTSNTWTYFFWYHDGTNDVIGVSINGAAATTTAHSTGTHNSTFDMHLGGVAYGNAKCLMESCSFWYGASAIKSTAQLAGLYGGGYGNPMKRG